MNQRNTSASSFEAASGQRHSAGSPCSGSASKFKHWFASTKSHRVKRVKSVPRARPSTESFESKHRSFKTLFSRPSISSISSTHKAPFTPHLPPELWIHILNIASAPTHPFLSSSLLSPSQPLSFMNFPHSHSHLIADYKASMRFKASLTRVCRLWNALGQQVLYEFVWITRAKEARLLAETLSSTAIRDVHEGGVFSDKGKQRATQHHRRPSNTSEMLSDANNFDYNNKGAFTYPYDTRGVGRHIRRLHIETPSLERCSSTDLLTILDHAPLLQVFSDYQSIRRNLGISIISPSHAGSASSSRPSSRGDASSPDSITGPTHIRTFRDHTQALKSTDQQVLSALLTHPNRSTSLRRLSWTNYDYEPQDYEGGVRFYLRVVGPKLEMAKEHLEFLELTLCARDLRGMGQGGGGFLESLMNMNTAPVMGINPNTLTTLSTSLTSTVTTTISSPSPSITRHPSIATLGTTSNLLSLPALSSLKVTLDNATFHVLSTWDMPKLRNLSVISADFSYAGEGFARFFEVHGQKLLQLELGHSTGAIEEFWLTAPPGAQQGGGGGAGAGNAPQHGWTFGTTRVPLAEWCPNLLEFICSADAEWNWQNPDWIAPHVLLPAHPTLQLIGVRDMEKRIEEGLGRVEWRDEERLRAGRGLMGIDGDGYDDADGGDDAGGNADQEDDPFFMLFEQFGSLLRREAFPNLRYVRDMSWASDVMRKSGRVPVKDAGHGYAGSVEGLEEEGGAASGGAASASANGGDHHASAHPPNLSNMLSGIMYSLNLTGARRRSSSFNNDNKSHSASTSHNSRSYMIYMRERQQARRVLRFWMKVLLLCRERGVWLEDCEGVNVTKADLKRAAVAG